MQDAAAECVILTPTGMPSELLLYAIYARSVSAVLGNVLSSSTFRVRIQFVTNSLTSRQADKSSLSQYHGSQGRPHSRGLSVKTIVEQIS